jgi:catechol 2,3-dioxygenase-like lactoylglutathione lyase family enzyme
MVGDMATLELTQMERFIRAAPDIEAAHKAVSRLGLTVSAPGPATDPGALHTVVTLGGSENRVVVEYLTHPDLAVAAADPGLADLVPLLEAGGGMRRLVFAVEDLAAARVTFGNQPGGFTEHLSQVAGGRFAVAGMTPGDTTPAGCRFSLVPHQPEMVAGIAGPVPGGHDFPLKRVDHVAVIPPDLEAGTRYWIEVLGCTVQAEIQGPGFLIRQIPVGDLMIELLAPTGKASPLAAAPPGLLPVLACEVDDIAACVDLARQRGFTPSDPGPGALPGTLVTTIPATETSGIQYQLLQYLG